VSWHPRKLRRHRTLATPGRVPERQLRRAVAIGPRRAG
jgi:hypothetical protein